MPGFRLSAKYIFLTYPQSDDIDLDAFYNRLLSITNVASVYCCRELHQDGFAHHHAFVAATRKFNITRENYFDLDFGGRNYHPNIEAVRNHEASNRYIGKDGNTRGQPILGARPGRKDDYRRILQEASDGAEFLELVEQADPVNYVLNYQKLEHFANSRFPPVVKYGTAYERESFGRVPELMEKWVREELFNGVERPKCLVVIGEPKWGKTKWAQSLGVPFNYWIKYVTNRRETGARYAILDDFVETKRSDLKGFFGCQEIIGVKVSNGVSGQKMWEWGIPTIFLFNPEDVPEYLNDVHSYEYKRSTQVTLQGPLF